jgi:hypothetical protein
MISLPRCFFEPNHHARDVATGKASERIKVEQEWLFYQLKNI